MKKSTRDIIPLPPNLKIPPGTTLYYESFFHEGPAMSSQTNLVLADQFLYDSSIPLIAFQQAVAAKVTVFTLVKNHVATYEKEHPNGYCAYVRTFWYTDKAVGEEVTPFMKNLQAPGVPSDF